MNQVSMNDPKRDISAAPIVPPGPDPVKLETRTAPLVPHRKLPALVRQLLGGDATAMAAYASPAQAERALIDALVLDGYDIVQIAAVLSVYATAGILAQRPPRTILETHQWLRSSVFFGSRDQAARTAIRLGAHGLERTRDALYCAPLRHTYTDAVLLMAHCAMATKHGQINHRASQKELWQGKLLCTFAMRNATYRLVARGLIAMVEPGKGRRSSLYRLLVPIPGVAHTGARPAASRTGNPAHAVFGPYGVGRAAGELYQALREQPSTLEQLLWRTGLSYSSVSAGLQRLVELGHHVSGRIKDPAFLYQGRWYATPLDLDEVASLLFADRWAFHL